MNTYLEIEEQLIPEDAIIKQPQIIRVAVASKDEAISKLPIYEPAFKGLNYIKRVHYCNHDTGVSCTTEPL